MIKLPKLIVSVALAVGLGLLLPTEVFAAGVTASGGGKYTVGQSFTVTVKASGAEFDSLQGKITVSGPVEVVSFSAGSATWLPGKSPSNGGQFVGIVSPTSSLTVATIKLKAKAVGSGEVSVSGVQLARNGSYVGSGASGTTFTVLRAPTPPGGVTVSSTTHPDQGVAYEATTVTLAWDKPAGVTEFATAFDQASETKPTASVLGSVLQATYPNLSVGTYYFHIKAKNGDGWGPVSHFKVSIKEPDPQINAVLAKPTIDAVARLSEYQTDLDQGTLSGMVVRGTGPAGFTINLDFKPALTVPAGTVLAPVVDQNGLWELVLNFPLKAGFYTLSAQGQNIKILTPVSDLAKFEVRIGDQGGVKFITLADAIQSPTPEPTPTPESTGLLRSMVNAVRQLNSQPFLGLGSMLFLLALIAFLVLRRLGRKKAQDPIDFEV